MRLLLFLLSIPAFAAVSNLSVLYSTSTQLAVTVTVDDPAACTFRISKEADFTPLALDADPAYFTGANACNRAGNIVQGKSVTLIIGKKAGPAIEQALNGYHLSRALQAASLWYIDVTQGNTATTTARTANILLGDSRGQGLAVHATDLWRYQQVTTNKLANPEFADPYTGALIKNPPALLGFGYAQSTATSGDGYSPGANCNITLTGVKGSCRFVEATGTNWSFTATSLTAAVQADDDNFATYSGTTQDKLWLRLGTGKFPTHSTLGGATSFQNLHFSAKTSDATGEGGWVRVCLTSNGVSCASPALRVTLTATEAVYSVCADSPCTVKDNPGDVMLDFSPGLIPGTARVYNESGTLTTLKFAGSNATAACNELIVGETIQVYDSRTNGISPYFPTVDAKSCGSAPPQITIPSGYDLAHNGTTGVTFWRNDGITGPRYGALVWKESTSSGSTISLDLPLWRLATTPAYTLAFGSGGFGKRCQNVPTAGGYYLCFTSSDANMIIGVKPGTDGLDIAYYGIAGWRGDLINAGLSNTGFLTGSSGATNDSMWDDETPGVFYMHYTSTTCGAVIVKMVLSLAAPAAPDPDGTAYPGGTRVRTAGLTSATILTPCGSGASDFSLSTQRGRISTEWVNLGSMFGSCSLEAVQGKTIIEACRAGSQDSHGFIFAWDLGNGLPAGAGFVGTQGGNTQQAFAGFLISANHASRWCGIHTYQNPLSAAGTPFALTELGDKAPMSWTVNTALSVCDSRSTPGTCSACPNVTLDGFNYNGKNWCSTIDVASSCASVSAPAGCTDGDPISSGATESPNLKWYQVALIGDVFNHGTELVKLLQKNSQTQWVVVRGWGNQSNSSSSDAFTPIAHSSGVSWRTFCGGHKLDPLTTAPEAPLGLAWYFGNDPLGTSSSYTFINRFQNHGFHAAFYGVFPDYTLSRFDFASPSANAASLTSGSYIALPTSFATKASFPNGNAVEKHPGGNQLRGDTSWFADLNPRMYHPAGANAVALASGKTYIYQYNGAAVISPKHYDLEAYMGRWPMRRVDTLTDSAADTGKWCVAIATNDCFSGSTAGKMYSVNEVFDTTFIPLATCRESQFGTTNGDDCKGPANGIGAAVTQWRVPEANGRNALNGIHTRAVSKEWRTYREAATENVKADPTGTALLARALWYVAPPPFPGVDTRNRSTFSSVPITIPNVPAGTNNVLVQFGDADFRCTNNRDNTCYSESATLNEANPFQFDHETLTGLSCASGCTVTLPVIANNLTYYRLVYRNASNVVISRSATSVVAVN